MLWVPLVFVGSLLVAVFVYLIVSGRVERDARLTESRASALPAMTKVGVFLVFWIASIGAVFASPLFAAPSLLGFAAAGLLFVAGSAVLRRTRRATVLLVLAVMATMGAGGVRSREFFRRADAVREYRNAREKRNPCCNPGPNVPPQCMSHTNPCPEGAMQVWRNAMASLVYGAFAHTSIALGGVGFLSLLLVLAKGAPSGPRFECRKCGKVIARAEQRCPKCGAIDCFEPK